MKSFSVLLICLVVLAFVCSLTTARSKNRRAFSSHHNQLVKRKFEGPEHRYVANNDGYIRLTDRTIKLDTFNFVNSKGVTLYTFGDIVAMAGDYYGPTKMNEVICTGDSFDAQEALFVRFWRQMWEETSQKNINTYKKLFDDQDDAIQKRPKGKSGAEVSEDLGEFRFLKAGGLPFVEMALHNLDHFGDCAVEAYKSGHIAAVKHARKASGLKNVTQANQILLEAYSMEAFSQHYLTDLFSAGHIRTPRRNLLKVCATQTLGDYNAGQLAQWMHDEDNKNGLWVRNLAGEEWKAYGDSSLVEEYAQKHVKQVSKASQASRDELYNAYLKPNVKIPWNALRIVPNLVVSLRSTCPLFRKTATGEIEVRKPWNQAFPAPCNYRPATVDDCPSAIGQKIKALFKQAVELEYSPKQKIWIVPSMASGEGESASASAYNGDGY